MGKNNRISEEIELLVNGRFELIGDESLVITDPDAVLSHIARDRELRKQLFHFYEKVKSLDHLLSVYSATRDKQLCEVIEGAILNLATSSLENSFKALKEIDSEKLSAVIVKKIFRNSTTKIDKPSNSIVTSDGNRVWARSQISNKLTLIDKASPIFFDDGIRQAKSKSVIASAEKSCWFLTFNLVKDAFVDTEEIFYAKKSEDGSYALLKPFMGFTSFTGDNWYDGDNEVGDKVKFTFVVTGLDNSIDIVQNPLSITDVVKLNISPVAKDLAKKLVGASLQIVIMTGTCPAAAADSAVEPSRGKESVVRIDNLDKKPGWVDAGTRHENGVRYFVGSKTYDFNASEDIATLHRHSDAMRDVEVQVEKIFEDFLTLMAKEAEVENPKTAPTTAQIWETSMKAKENLRRLFVPHKVYWKKKSVVGSDGKIKVVTETKVLVSISDSSMKSALHQAIQKNTTGKSATLKVSITKN